MRNRRRISVLMMGGFEQDESTLMNESFFGLCIRKHVWHLHTYLSACGERNYGNHECVEK